MHALSRDTLNNQEGTHLLRRVQNSGTDGIVGFLFFLGGISLLHRFARTELLIGKEGVAKLENSTVAIFGVGGVGSYVVEALARSGIGNLVLVDHDTVSLTNINRQLPALDSTIGHSKVAVMKERVLAINPNCRVEAIQQFYDKEQRDHLIRSDYTYIVDGIDSITAKIDLIVTAMGKNIPIVSSMGAGNKLDPTQFKLTDISKTHTCPMAKTVRKLLRGHGINKGLTVVFSTEMPLTPLEPYTEEMGIRRQLPGSIAFVPSVAGLFLASKVVNDIIGH